MARSLSAASGGDLSRTSILEPGGIGISRSPLRGACPWCIALRNRQGRRPVGNGTASCPPWLGRKLREPLRRRDIHPVVGCEGKLPAYHQRLAAETRWESRTRHQVIVQVPQPPYSVKLVPGVTPGQGIHGDMAAGGCREPEAHSRLTIDVVRKQDMRGGKTGWKAAPGEGRVPA
jgi:hypothetical protein